MNNALVCKVVQIVCGMHTGRKATIPDGAPPEHWQTYNVKLKGTRDEITHTITHHLSDYFDKELKHS